MSQVETIPQKTPCILLVGNLQSRPLSYDPAFKYNDDPNIELVQNSNCKIRSNHGMFGNQEGQLKFGQKFRVFIAKAPWSWGRTYDVLSEGCKIEPRCQLEKLAIALIETQSKRVENDTRITRP